MTNDSGAGSNGTPLGAAYFNWIYVVEGSILAVSNLTICLLICRYQALRRQKGYVIISALALADGMAGVAQLIAGVWRLLLIRRGW